MSNLYIEQISLHGTSSLQPQFLITVNNSDEVKVTLRILIPILIQLRHWKPASNNCIQEYHVYRKFICRVDRKSLNLFFFLYL